MVAPLKLQHTVCHVEDIYKKLYLFKRSGDIYGSKHFLFRYIWSIYIGDSLDCKCRRLLLQKVLIK